MLGAGEVFAREELERLAHQRRQVEDALTLLGTMVEDAEARTFDREAIQQLLSAFEEVFEEDLKPYQRKTLLGWALERIELSPKQLKVGLKVRPAAHAIRPVVGETQADLKPAISPASQFFPRGKIALAVWFDEAKPAQRAGGVLHRPTGSLAFRRCARHVPLAAPTLFSLHSRVTSATLMIH